MPNWRELKRFLDREGWELYKDTDHYYYRKTEDTGDILRTRVSKGSGEIPRFLWKEIRGKQLRVSQEYFDSRI